MSDDVKTWARQYFEAGLSAVPLAEGTKKPPSGFRWTQFYEKPETKRDIESLFRGRENVGLLGGSASRNLLVLDVDSRDKWAELDSISAFRWLKANEPVCRTRRGFHVYLQAPYPVAKGRAPQWSADIIGERSYAVAPPSKVAHEHGVVQLYLFADGGFRPVVQPRPDVWNCIENLFGLRSYEAAFSPDIVADSAAGLVFYGLGWNNMQALLEPRRRGLRSEAELAIVRRAVSLGWSFGEVLELFDRFAAQGTKYHEKKQAGEAEKWLLTEYKSALQFYQDHMLTPRLRIIGAAIDWLAHDTPFRGRARYTDALVLRAILQAERESNVRPVAQAIRTLAERVGVSVRAVFEAVGRLQEAGAVSVQRLSGQALAFDVPDRFLASLEPFGLLAKPNTIFTLLGGYGGEVSQGDSSVSVIHLHDAFRRSALGSSGPALVRKLNERARSGEPFAVLDLMLEGFSFRYVQKALSLFERTGLVQVSEVRKLKHGRPQKFYSLAHIIRHSDLDAVAKIAGTAGALEKQRQKHKEEREAFELLKASWQRPSQ